MPPSDNYRYGNDIVIDAVERYQTILGYITVNPNYPEDMENELKRCLAINGFIGIKLHPECHGSAVDSINYNAAFELANEEKLPI